MKAAFPNPYDELQYRSRPIEWTAPERLALTSVIHGGPRTDLASYRVLELGCADGSNLLPLAFYRQNAEFVGIDNANSQVEIARSRNAELAITNVEFLDGDFMTADEQLTGKFDYIIAHGVFSWLSGESRDALLTLCRKRLNTNGLFYLNYNTKPGWNIRGLVRDFVMAQTENIESLKTRAETAQELAFEISNSFENDEHPFAKLMANEFKFICDHHSSYIAHEYLAQNNHSYWRSEFLDLIQSFDFEYVADADFCYDTGRIDDKWSKAVANANISYRSLEDTLDLFSYRQLHSPILTHSGYSRRNPTPEEFQEMFIASCLVPAEPNSSGNPTFEHPNGFQVEAKGKEIDTALHRLHSIWPHGIRVREVFENANEQVDDLLLLQRNGLIDLRLINAVNDVVNPDPLNALESQYADYQTSAYHVREPLSVQSDPVHSTFAS